MQFPIVNIFEKWKNEDVLEYILFDPYIYTRSEKLFDKYFRNKKFCDCKGDLYQVVGKNRNVPVWRRIFFFLPNVYRELLLFKKLEQSISLNEAKQLLKQHSCSLNSVELENQFKNAKSFKELFDGSKSLLLINFL